MHTVRAPIQVAIAGFGRMGSYHADRLAMRPEFRLVAVCDGVEARRQLAAESCRVPVYEAFPDLLARSDLDVVFICTPSSSHAAMAIQSVGAGKHTVVEKPMSMTVAEARQMAVAAREADRTLTVVQNRRWDDTFRTALEVARSGRIGTLEAVKLIAWSYSNLMQTYGVKEFVTDWRARREFGGGLLYDFGAHHLDQLLVLVESPVVEVYGDLQARRWSDEVDDTFVARVRFANGVRAHVEVSHASLAPLVTGWVLAGSKGGYRDFNVYHLEDGELVETEVERLTTDWDQFYENLGRHLIEGEPLAVTPEHALEVVRVMEAVRRSAECREVVRLS